MKREFRGYKQMPRQCKVCGNRLTDLRYTICSSCDLEIMNTRMNRNYIPKTIEQKCSNCGSINHYFAEDWNGREETICLSCHKPLSICRGFI
jgi:hypothetical protein